MIIKKLYIFKQKSNLFEIINFAQRNQEIMNKFTLSLVLALFIFVSHVNTQCSVYCQKCNDVGLCEQCKDPYNLNEKGICKIFKPIEGCLIYSTQLGTDKCITCNKDRQLVNGKCVRISKYCQSVDETSQCKKCIDGYQLIGRQCLSKNIKNCPLAHFAFQNYCRPYPISNCIRINQEICDICSLNSILINGVCLPKDCSITPLKNSTCIGTIFQNMCYNCKSNNCLLSQNGIHCELCASSYILIGGMCYRPVKYDDINCNLIDYKSQICTGCNNEYKLDRNSFCVRDFNVGIKQCMQSPLFDVFQDGCFYRDRNCQKIKPQNFQCLSCIQGFTLRAGKCQKTEKCTTKTIHGDCIDCLSEFYLHPLKRTCEQKPRNCINFNIQQNRCNLCKGPTNLTNLTKGNRTTCAYIQSKCSQYNYQGTCLSCVQGYTIKNRICTMKAEYCQTLNPVDQTLCSNCTNGYKLQDQKCYQNIYGCLRYNATTTKCIKCSRSLILFDGKCIFVDKYCVQYNGQGNCIRCSQGLLPFTNKCVYYEPYCTSYGLDRTCNKAINGFTIRSNISSDSKQEYRIFVLSSNKIKTITNLKTEIKSRSISDSKGFYAENGVIYYYPLVSLQSKSIKQMRNYYQIVSCQDTYVLYQGLCIKKQSFDDRCKQYNIITLQCVQCQQGNDMGPTAKCQKRSNKTCVQSDKNTDSCTRCNQKEGFFNLGGWCVSKQINTARDERHFQIVEASFMWSLLPNCIQQKQIAKCLFCDEGYNLLDGKCIVYQKYCDSYHPAGFCQKCQPQYSLQGGNCVPFNCQISTSLTCSNCLKGFEYQSGKCYPPKPAYCLIYTPNECRLCEGQYYLTQQKKCQKSLPNCVSMNSTSLQCIQCEQLYTLSRQKCIPTIQFCSDYTLDGKCRKCLQNSNGKYQLLNGICKRIPTRCIRLNQSQSCQQCEKGYALFKNQCVIYRQNCQSYDRTGRCFKCAQSFVLRNGVCFATISYCKQQSQCQNKCLKCFEGYQLTKDNTCAVSDSKCKEFQNGFCTVCQSGYFIGTTGSGFCEKNPENCQKYSIKDRKCISCIPNYILANNQCILKSLVLNGCVDQKLQQANCLVCQSGFTLKNGLCYGSNCLTFTPQRNCLECPRYYRQSKRDNRLCQPHFCRIYSQGPTCDLYEQNYIGGFLIHNSGRISIQYCKQYDSVSNNCTQCEPYRFPQYIYQYSPCFPYNCLNTSQIKCTKCKPGFSISAINQGTCLASYCYELQNNGTCKVCTKPYIRNQQGLCVTNSICLQFIPNTPTCKKCQNYYNLNEAGECLAQNCDEQKIDPSEGCAKCRLGFQRTDNGGCKLKFCQIQLLDSFCRTCAQNYRKNNMYGICQPKNCQNYQRQSYKCNKCSLGFRLDNGFCRPTNCKEQKNLQCTLCQSGYMPSPAGKCETQFCKRFSNARTCLQCQNGYLLNLQTNLCQTQNSFCIQSDSSNNCLKCSTGFVLNNNKTCVFEVKGCKIYGVLQCQTCNKGLQFKDKLCKVMNCLSEQSPNICSKCKTGYQLTSQGLCKVKNCEMFSQQGWTCNNCFGRFSLYKGLCQARDCSMFSVLDEINCFLCNQDFDLIDGGCLHKNCQNPKDSRCKNCIEGWVPDYKGVCSNRSCLTSEFKTGTCKTCDVGKRLSKDVCISDRCLSRLQGGQCNLCDRSFYLANNRQYCVAYFCKNWDPNNGECLKCADDFTLEKSICINRQCKKFNNTNNMIMPFCEQCSMGYYAYNQYCVPNRCMNQGYDPLTGLCSECVFSFEPIDGVCQLQNCLKFAESVTDFSQCIVCKLGFELQSGICLTSNCSQFQGSTNKCTACNYGFYLVSDICLAYNCLTYDPDGKCRVCQPSYNLQANYTCTRKNCLQDSIEECLKCQDGYQIIDKYCQSVNCKTISQNTCIECQNGYIKDNNICKDINCDIFSDTYKCEKCRRGFKLSRTTGRCQIQYTTFCPIGQYYSQLRLMCQKINIQNCKYAEYNQPNYCIECLPGYFLLNGLCQSMKGCTKFSYINGCSQCKDGLRLMDRICVNADSFCLYKIDGKCSSCKQSYYLNKNNECIQKPVNCKQFSKDFQCLKCQNNFELVSQSRGCKASNCISFDPDSMKCKQCSPNYQLKEGSCSQFTISNCLKLQKGVCSKCEQSYILNSKFCVRKVQNCQSYNDNACVGCSEGFSLNRNNSCVKISEGCQLFGINGVCLICRAGFTRFETKCIKDQKKQTQNKKPINFSNNLSIRETSLATNLAEPQKDSSISYVENCLIQDDLNQMCIICSSDFYRTSSGKCLPMPEYCKFVDYSGKCYSCMDGYSLEQNKCKIGKKQTNVASKQVTYALQVNKSAQNLRKKLGQ